MSWKARISHNVQQVRFFYCANSMKGAGLRCVTLFACEKTKTPLMTLLRRAFVGNNYHELKMLNPLTPFLVRHMPEADTELWVKYDFGAQEVLWPAPLVTSSDTQGADAKLGRCRRKPSGGHAARAGVFLRCFATSLRFDLCLLLNVVAGPLG
jgi:hypothetical protein